MRIDLSLKIFFKVHAHRQTLNLPVGFVNR